MRNLLLFSVALFLSIGLFGQTLIMNEVSQGVTGNMEYVEFVVVDNTAIYDCSSGQPPSIDIRGWIFDDNSGYHGAGGIAAGCIRFSFDPLWSAIPMGTIILIYNGAEPDPSIPPIDISLNDGNCSIVVPVTDVNLFESNPTTPGAVSCSYPTTGWIPGGNWSNTLLANTSDCARIVNLDGCEVFSVCWGADNLNNLIYFSGNAGNIVYYFNDSDPTIQANWTAGCTDNETILDANTCGSNDQTPGAPNNALNAAFIAQFNNGCSPIPPLVANAMIDNHEICGCDGSATATPSGSIPGYTYEWFDASMTPIGQTGITAINLCSGDYFVEITSSIGCQEMATVTVNPGSGIPSVTSVNGGASYCSSDPVSNITAAVTGIGPWDVTYTINGGSVQTASGLVSPIILGNTPGVYVVTGVTDANCSNTASGTQSIIIIADNTVTPSSSDPIICVNTAIPSVTFTTTGATGIGAAVNLPAGVTASFAGNTITVSGTPSASGTFNFTIPLTGGCGTQEAMGTIIVNAPAPSTFAAIAPICAGDALTLPSSSIEGFTGTWSPAVDNMNTTTYIFTPTAGQCATTATITVNVGPPSIPNFSAIAPICAGDALTLPSSSIEGFTGTWSPAVDNMNTTTYTFTPTAGQCATTASITVNVGPPSTPTFSAIAPICAGDPLTLPASSIEGFTGTWSPAVDNMNTTTYTFTPTAGQCATTTTSTVTVNPIPLAPTAGNDSTYCSSWILVPITATGGTGTMTWYDDATLTGVITTGGSLTPFDTDGITVYYVTETAVGCEGPASMVTITIQNCEMTIPTAITPNADGLHDDWEIYGLDVAYPNNVVRIYNRWGGLLYEHDSSVDGPYDSNRWKGEYNGEALPVGSYYFIIELNDEDKSVESGAVSVLLEK